MRVCIIKPSNNIYGGQMGGRMLLVSAWGNGGSWGMMKRWCCPAAMRGWFTHKTVSLHLSVSIFLAQKPTENKKKMQTLYSTCLIHVRLCLTLSPRTNAQYFWGFLFLHPIFTICLLTVAELYQCCDKTVKTLCLSWHIKVYISLSNVIPHDWERDIYLLWNLPWRLWDHSLNAGVQ